MDLIKKQSEVMEATIVKAKGLARGIGLNRLFFIFFKIQICIPRLWITFTDAWESEQHSQDVSYLYFRLQILRDQTFLFLALLLQPLHVVKPFIHFLHCPTSFYYFLAQIYYNEMRILINSVTQKFKQKMSQVEETLSRMKTHKNVQGIVIVNAEGSIIRTTYENQKKEEGNNIARLIPQLVLKAKSTIRDLDTENELKFIRLKTAKNQILVAPDNQFILVVVQGQKSEHKEEDQP